MTSLETRAVRYAFEVEINASADRVWSLLNDDSSSWFPSSYHSSATTKGFIMEQFVGGRFYEDYGNGNGKLLGTVVVLEARRKVTVEGAVTPDFGGPATQLFTIEIEDTAVGCKLKFDDSLFGHLPDEVLEGRQGAFKQLFGEFLKAAAEA